MRRRRNGGTVRTAARLGIGLVRRVAVGTIVLVVLAGLATLGMTRAYPTLRARPHAGAVWVASTVGELALIDGVAAEVAPRVPVARNGSHLVADVTVRPVVPTASCGDVITEDTTLNIDLHCTDTALTIGAPNVTVDLNRHTISGTGTGSGINARVNNVSVDNLSIRNGAITGFGAGIELGVSTGVSITNMRLINNNGMAPAHGGIYLQDTRQVNVQGGEIRDSGPGAYVDTTTDVTIAGVSFASAGIILADPFRTTITGNTFTDASIVLTATASGNLISRNTLMRSTITAELGATQNTIRENRIQGANVGVTLGPESRNNPVINNTFINNRIGLQIQNSIGTAVSGNTFIGNGAAGAFIQFSDSVSGSFTISGNTFRSNGRNSNGMTDSAGASVNDGLHIDVPAGSVVLVSNNHTFANADFGIEARWGTVQDGGGNTSSGDPSGCLGVVCA